MKKEEVLSINDFLKLPNPKKYDFSNEKAKDDYIKLNGFNKFFIYMIDVKKDDFSSKEKDKLFIDAYKKIKELYKENDYGDIIDPDSQSNLLQEIYKILFKDNDYIKNKNKIQGETLNSANTTLNRLYELIENEEEKEERKHIGNNVSNKYRISRYLTNSKTIIELKKIDKVKRFLEAYHTIGNFMPIPKGCNSPRGFNNRKIEDYWDLTLLNIYRYYVDNNYKALEIIVGEDNLSIYKNWLDIFGKGIEGWISFIESNYLENFVGKKKDNYYPQELWKDHFKENKSVIPETKKECLAYFKNTTKLIKKRSKRMIKELKKENKNEPK